MCGWLCRRVSRQTQLGCPVHACLLERVVPSITNRTVAQPTCLCSHRRYAGGDTSSVLLGMQVVPGEGEAFRGKVADLDGSFVFRELSDRAYDVFSTFLS